MNWSKTGSGRAKSFTGALNYALHDRGAPTQNRVGLVAMDNLAAVDPKRAWREMQTTVDAAEAMKARSGIKSGKTASPAYLFTLSWHPDDRPDSAHMIATARKAVAALGLSAHQAIIVEHTNRPHKHVHVMVNLIHPDTGKTARLYRDEQKLDRWAHDYELSRETIRSFARAAKFEGGKTMERKKDAFNVKATDERTRALQDEIRGKRDALEMKHTEAAGVREKEKRVQREAYQKSRDDIRSAIRTLKASHTAREEKARKEKAESRKLDLQKTDDRKPEKRNVEKRKSETPALTYDLEGTRIRQSGRDWVALAQALQQTKTIISDAIKQGRKSIFDLADKDRMGHLSKRFADHVRILREPNTKAAAKYIELARAAASYRDKMKAMTERHAREIAQQHKERVQFRAEASRAQANLRKELGLRPVQDQWQKSRDAIKAEHDRVSKRVERPVDPRVNSPTDALRTRADMQDLAASIRPDILKQAKVEAPVRPLVETPLRPVEQERPVRPTTVRPGQTEVRTITTPATPSTDPARIVTHDVWDRGR